MGRGGGVVVVDGRSTVCGRAGARTAARCRAADRGWPAEPLRPAPGQQQAGGGGGGNQGREGQVQHRQPQEGEGRDHRQGRMVQGAPSESPGGMQHHGHHGGFERPEHRRQQRQLPPQGIHRGQGREDYNGGQQEQAPGQQAAQRSVQQPADVGGQLGGLRPRQEHAVVEGVQVAPLGKPASLFHQFAVQQRDLPGRTAEAHQTEPNPEAAGLLQGGRPHSWIIPQRMPLRTACTRLLTSRVFSNRLV